MARIQEVRRSGKRSTVASESSVAPLTSQTVNAEEYYSPAFTPHPHLVFLLINRNITMITRVFPVSWDGG